MKYMHTCKYTYTVKLNFISDKYQNFMKFLNLYTFNELKY